MTIEQRAQIAGRIRGLLAGQDAGLPDAARRLGVDEVALRMSTDELAPYPTIDVIAAVIRLYGVDPSWLLTGHYDGATHRESLEAENLVSTLNRVLRDTPESSPVTPLRIMRDA